VAIVKADPHPFSLPGGDTKVLLLHGFTGSPCCLRPLAEWLNARGYGVEAPLLIGHGTDLEDLIPVRHRQWTDQVDAEIRRLQQSCKRLVVGGLSLGSILALQAGLRHQQLAGLMLYSPPIGVRDRRRFFAPLLKHFVATLPKPADHFEDPTASDRRWSYHRYPVACSAQVLQLIAQVSKQAKQLTLPTLVIGSRKDKVVSQQGIGQLVRRLDPEITSLHWLEDSGHVITLDQEWLKVASLSEEFLGRLSFDDGN